VRRLREKKSHRFLDVKKIESILQESSKKWLLERSTRLDESRIAEQITGSVAAS
jgi:hypothetical protein